MGAINGILMGVYAVVLNELKFSVKLDLDTSASQMRT